jgi:Fe-S-cluster containining protein
MDMGPTSDPKAESKMLNKRANKRQSDFFDVCSNCRTSYSCCNDTTPPITFERRKIIETYLRENKISFGNPFHCAGYVFPRLMSDGYCVFHDKKTRKCVIHPVKPETCVAGPITFDINAKTGKIEWFIKMEKVCQLAGVVYEDKNLLRKHLESAKKELMRLVTQLGIEELKVVLKKDEPETFKIGEEILEKRATS